jgi:LmbE family N-acetylglucosaminyl deacetylase
MLTEQQIKEILSKQILLVLAPHPDDETIGAGGLIAKIKDSGGKVYVLVFSAGTLEHFSVENADFGESLSDGRSVLRRVSVEKRVTELEEVMRFFEVDGWDLFYKDSKIHMQLDTLPRKELINIIERKSSVSLEKIRPTMVCIPHPSFNQDHEAVFNASISALRPYLYTTKAFQNIVMIMDAPHLAWGKEPFRPNFYVDITKYLDKKLQAYKLHKSQVRPEPHISSVESLQQLALWRGKEISTYAAEAYQCIRFVL